MNKLDTVDWSKERFDELSEALRLFLQKQTGFSNVEFVPVSGLMGDNLTKRPPADHPLMQWYTGKTLIEVLGTSFVFCLSSITKTFRSTSGTTTR